jgi:hypothetical protein
VALVLPPTCKQEGRKIEGLLSAKEGLAALKRDESSSRWWDMHFGFVLLENRLLVVEWWGSFEQHTPEKS